MSLWLGIDIGGTKTAIALGRADGTLVATWRGATATTTDAVADLRRLGEEALRLVTGAGHAVSALRGVGVAVPGPFDGERGVLLTPPNLPWRDAPVARVLGEMLQLPVQLENDANAAALAEWRFGAGRGARDLVYLTMSTGVGAGMVLGGQLVRGVGSHAGEWGHVAIEWEGARCGCGRRGCLEAYVGGANWAQRLRRETPNTSRVAALAGDDPISPVHLVAAAREGDAFAVAEFARWRSYLARGLIAIAYALAPEVIVLGTIATAAGEALCFEPLRAELDAALWPSLRGKIRVVPAALDEDRPYLAGLCAAFELLDSPAASAARRSS
jgi:glucokinase